MTIVLLQPPFFRLAGSHNDRPMLNLCYASSFLEDAGMEHVVVNADYLGSTVHVPWRQLVENVEYWKAACEDRSPLLDQCEELVMQFCPDVVVVAAGDDLIPTKNLGSPYTASLISQRLRKHGIKTIGVGPQFVRDQGPFEEYFDEFFPAMMNRSIVDVLRGDEPDVISGSPAGTLPSFKHVWPRGQVTDYVLTSFGCVHDCTFCLAPVVSNRQVMFQPVELAVADIRNRAELTGRKQLYLADMIFPLNVRRLQLMADALEGGGLTFACESRVNTVRPEMLKQMWRMGVRTVKIGLETLDDEALKAISKGQTVLDEEKAIGLLKEAGFQVVGYLLFGEFYGGSVVAMEATLDRVAALDLDYAVVNVVSYDRLDWERRYDAHFSLLSARQQGVPDDVLFRALELADTKQNPTLEKVKTCA